jgi:hypothetical protein
MNVRRIGMMACVGLAVGLAALVPSAVATADAAATPIGVVTAEQYQGNFCDDFGAHVRVRIDGGHAGTTYTAIATGVFQEQRPFPVNAMGAGMVDLHNVNIADGRGAVGTATVMVSGGNYTVSVPVTINCPGNGNG